MSPTPSSTPSVVDALGMEQAAIDCAKLDDRYSHRYIELDPAGYFIVYVDHQAGLICAEHYTNLINDRGIACDPETGEPLPCTGGLKRSATATFTGRTAKELCIRLFEETKPCPVSYLDHAAYLGREFLRAEIALFGGQDYIQD